MLGKLSYRLLTETRPRLLGKFAYNFAWKGAAAVRKFNQRLARGEIFPAFVVISITDKCNLSCQGCWVTQTSPGRELSVGQIQSIIDACKAKGSYFFGLLGGEPLLHRGLFDIFTANPDCYFQLFTNGVNLDDATAAKLAAAGNVTPLISIEGDEAVSDIRRGGGGVFNHAMTAIENCRRHKLVIGTASSVCKSNIDHLASEKHVDEMIADGVHYLWYYIYRPVGPRPCPELALDGRQIDRLRRFIVDTRPQKPIIIVDAYWDDQGRAICPAATGLSHHIGPGGDIEFCPPIQLADGNATDGRPLAAHFAESEFLRGMKKLATKTSRGCVLLENPAEIAEYAAAAGAIDSSGRGAAIAELNAMRPLPGHHRPNNEIPEKHWLYRFAKKRWFFGFGAYG